MTDTALFKAFLVFQRRQTSSNQWSSKNLGLQPLTLGVWISVETAARLKAIVSRVCEFASTLDDPETI
jgi:hypothetical protein